jgi:hypothetical protein
MKHRILVLAVALVAAASAVAQADVLTLEAFDNATVRPTGPRSGSSGKAYFNIEGTVQGGAYASYGVADFNFGTLSQTVLDINSMSLQLTQDNAAFTHDGGLVFSLDTNITLADIQSGTSPLAFDGADPGTDTDVSQGDLDLALLGGGPFSFVTVATGTVDVYNFTLDAAAEAEIIARLNSGGTIRIVIGSGDSMVAATWSGYTNSSREGPTLTLDVETGVVGVKPSSWAEIKGLYRD